MDNRRNFIKKVAVTSAGLAIGDTSFGFSAKSYKNILGANDRIHVAGEALNNAIYMKWM